MVVVTVGDAWPEVLTDTAQFHLVGTMLTELVCQAYWPPAVTC